MYLLEYNQLLKKLFLKTFIKLLSNGNLPSFVFVPRLEVNIKLSIFATNIRLLLLKLLDHHTK